MRQSRLGVPEIGCDGQQTTAVHYLPGFGPRTFDDKGDNRAAAFLLAASKVELRVRRQAGVVDAPDPWVLLQPQRKLQRSGRLRFEANLQRLQPFQQDPGVESGERRTGCAQELEYLVGQPSRPGDSAAEDAPLPIEELGRRMDDQISTKIKWSLQDRRAEAVIDRHQHAPLGGRRVAGGQDDGTGRRGDGHHGVGPMVRGLDQLVARFNNGFVSGFYACLLYTSRCV